jgi:hypothetical protein
MLVSKRFWDLDVEATVQEASFTMPDRLKLDWVENQRVRFYNNLGGRLVRYNTKAVRFRSRL